MPHRGHAQLSECGLAPLDLLELVDLPQPPALQTLVLFEAAGHASAAAAAAAAGPGTVKRPTDSGGGAGRQPIPSWFLSRRAPWRLWCEDGAAAPSESTAQPPEWCSRLSTARSRLALHVLGRRLHSSLRYCMLGLPADVALEGVQPLEHLSRSLTRLQALTLHAPGCRWSSSGIAEALAPLKSVRALRVHAADGHFPCLHTVSRSSPSPGTGPEAYASALVLQTHPHLQV